MSQRPPRLTGREAAVLAAAAERVYELARQAATCERALRDQLATIQRVRATVDELARENCGLRAERDSLRRALERNAAGARRQRALWMVPLQERAAAPSTIIGGRMAPQRAA